MQLPQLQSRVRQPRYFGALCLLVDEAGFLLEPKTRAMLERLPQDERGCMSALSEALMEALALNGGGYGRPASAHAVTGEVQGSIMVSWGPHTAPPSQTNGLCMLKVHFNYVITQLLHLSTCIYGLPLPLLTTIHPSHLSSLQRLPAAVMLELLLRLCWYTLMTSSPACAPSSKQSALPRAPAHPAEPPQPPRAPPGAQLPRRLVAVAG